MADENDWLLDEYLHCTLYGANRARYAIQKEVMNGNCLTSGDISEKYDWTHCLHVMRNCFSKAVYQRFCILPTNAFVGHRDAVFKLFPRFNFLIPLVDETLKHDSSDQTVAAVDLLSHVSQDMPLSGGILVETGMATIEDNAGGHVGLTQKDLNRGDIFFAVIGPVCAAAHDQMRVRIAACLGDHDPSVAVDTYK